MATKWQKNGDKNGKKMVTIWRQNGKKMAKNCHQNGKKKTKKWR